MGKQPSDEAFSTQETVARREAALKRMLATPHQPHIPKGKTRPPCKGRVHKGKAKG